MAINNLPSTDGTQNPWKDEVRPKINEIIDEVNTHKPVDTVLTEGSNNAARSGDVREKMENKADLEVGKNKFDKGSILPGYFMGNNGATTPSSDYNVSDYIPVTEGGDYISNLSARFTCYFDSDKNVVIGGSNVDTVEFTIPFGVAFVRVTVNNDRLDTYMLEEGVSVSIYEPYKLIVPSSQLNFKTESNWKGTECNVMGDSITAQNLWQPHVALSLGLDISSFGIGGTTISGTSSNSMNNDNRINALSNTSELVMVMGGTNDWAQNIPLGLESSIDILTFYGALNVMIDKLLNKYYTNKLTQIVFIGTPYGELYEFESRGWLNAYTNNQGLTTMDYRDAVKNRCRYYNLPFIDSSRFGWNTINIRDYLIDDGGLLHLNTDGGERMAAIILGELSSIEPISN